MFVAAGNLTLFRYIDTSEGKAKQMKLSEPTKDVILFFRCMKVLDL